LWNCCTAAWLCLALICFGFAWLWFAWVLLGLQLILLLCYRRAGLRCWPSAESFSNLPGL
jgi:hypothetical protein